MSTNTQIILGISAYYHDSAAALVINGEIIAAAEEERFTREKHTSDFPIEAVRFCLQKANIKLSQVDAVVFYDKPLLKFERILETTYHNVPRGFRLFHKSIPVWMNSKLNMRKTIQKALKELEPNYKLKAANILFTTHHLSHAASAFFPSPFQKAAILTIDGVGEWATVSIGRGEGTHIELIRQMNFPDSVGLLYSAFTYFLGFKVNSGEYKLMGLSPYGGENNSETIAFVQKIKEHLVTIFPDGSIRMNPAYFNYSGGLKMIKVKKWEKLFDLPKKEVKEAFTLQHANLALAIQLVTEEIVISLAQTAKRLTGEEKLVMAGGVALNCVANGKLFGTKIFEDIWIQPAAGDSGGALGAALSGYFLLDKNSSRVLDDDRGFMKNGLLGPEVKEGNLPEKIETYGLFFTHYSDKEKLNAQLVTYLTGNKLLGWIQNREEFGPRALGARSILASPLSKSNQTRINKEVKFREDFRPFAPVMLAVEAERLYNFSGSSPYMQVVQKIKPEFRKALPGDFENLSIREKVTIPTSVLEAVTHVDYSSRLQLVSDTDHPLFELLSALKTKTGYGVLLNTSFNRAGEPIVSSLTDIFECFTNTALDYLVIGNYVIRKTEKD